MPSNTSVKLLGQRNEGSALLLLAAVLSYVFWLVHSFAVRSFIKTLVRLVTKFGIGS